MSVMNETNVKAGAANIRSNHILMTKRIGEKLRAEDFAFGLLDNDLEHFEPIMQRLTRRADFLAAREGARARKLSAQQGRRERRGRGPWLCILPRQSALYEA